MSTNTGDTDWLDEILVDFGQVLQRNSPEAANVIRGGYRRARAAIIKKLEWEKQEAVKNAVQVHHKQYPNCPPPLQAIKEKLG